MKRKRSGPYYEAGRAAYKRGYARTRRYRASGLRVQRIGYGSVARTRGAPVTGEMKYFDCTRNVTSIVPVDTDWDGATTTMMDPSTTVNLGDAAVATPGCLFAPKVSSALNGRIGRKVKVLKLKMRITVEAPLQSAQAALDSAIQVRLILVQDKQTNAAAMTASLLMNNGGDADSTLDSFQNPNNFGRFKVLRDKSCVFQTLAAVNNASATTVSQAGLMKVFKFNIKFRKPLEVNFNATNGGTVADIIDNSFHLIAATDSAGLLPEISYYSRVCYKE